MSAARIAVFADRGSAQAERLARILEAEGARPALFDIQLGGPGAPRMTDDGERLLWQGVDLLDYRAVHLRCWAPNILPAMPPVLDAISANRWRGTYIREQGYRSTLHGFFDELASRGILVVNPLSGGWLDHDAKAQFCFKLRAWGHCVPETLLTSDPDEAQAIVERVGRVVAKPAIGIGAARLVSEADLARSDEIRRCPVLLQEYVPGRVIRAHVVGDTVVLALWVRGSHLDSRTAPEGLEYHRMPDEDQTRLVAVTRRLGLHWAAWDLVCRDDGSYVCLDCNAGPWLLWTGATYADAVLTQLARYLIGYAHSGSVAAASACVEPWSPRGTAAAMEPSRRQERRDASRGRDDGS